MSSNQYYDRAPSAQRTSSFGNFIKRTKSNDILTNSGRASPGPGTLLREKSLESEPRPSIPATPPALPALASPPVIESFGGENYVPAALMSPKAPNGHHGAVSTPGSTNDHHVREHSMTNRSRYSYAHSISSSLASPRRVRRRKDPNPYNILVIGAKNSGKTSFINFLKASLAMPPHKQALRNQDSDYTPTISKAFHNFTHHYQEIDIDHERVGLTLWDSEGLEKGLIDLQLRDLTGFVESKFEETFAEENKVLRSPGARDTQIHVIFMILDPSRLATNLILAEHGSSSSLSRGGKTTRIVGALDEDFELQVLRSFQGKATVVPVISKADSVTSAQMLHLKKMVWQGFKQAGLDPLEALNIVQESEDELDEEDNIHDGTHGSEDNSPPVTPHSDDSEAFHDTNDGQSKPQMTHKRNISKTSISSQMMDTGYVPMSILSPDDYTPDPYTGRVGRRFPWGFADPFDPAHCDFVKLKEAVFNEWRNEVREASREMFYERWRTNRLNRKFTAPKVQSPTQARKPSGGIPIELMSNKRTETF